MESILDYFNEMIKPGGREQTVISDTKIVFSQKAQLGLLERMRDGF